MPPMTEPFPAEPTTALDEGQYLRSIASCGDNRPLIALQPIYSANGIKLLDTGARIDSRILDRLFGHTLSAPIDQSVTSEDAVNHPNLVKRCRELVAVSAVLAHFDGMEEAVSARLWRAMEACPLPPAITIRLMVVREAAPRLYEHSLRCAFLALFIGVRARFSDGDLQLLATAALLHDIGMMHADPAPYEAESPLDVAARRSLHVHPLTGEIIAQRESLLNRSIATAIAEHHERIDGTGYPRHLPGESISKLGRALMLADAVLGIIERHPARAARQLSLLLRFNHRSFDAGLCEALLAALPRNSAMAGVSAEACAEFALVISLVDSWTQATNGNLPSWQDGIADLIEHRISHLRHRLVEAGLGDLQAALAVGNEEPQVCEELAALGREAIWQMRQIAYDASERLSQQRGKEGVATPDAVREWIAKVLQSDPSVESP